MTSKDSARLILLVGSNPLPNFLAACALRPSTVVLMYTNETEQAKGRLKSELERVLGAGVVLDDSCGYIQDATCATTVWRVIKPLLSQADQCNDVWLNYTGGTKVMSAHARMAYAQSGGKPEHASYLDEGDTKQPPRLRFDDGNSERLSDYPDVAFSVDAILALHGITHQPRRPKAPAPTEADAHTILARVVQDPSVADNLYDERERLEDREYRNPTKAVPNPFRADRYGLELSLSQFPTQEKLDELPNGDVRKSWFKQWYKFIGGEWLEEWVGTQLRALELTPTPEITIGVNAYRGGNEAQLEVDVAVIRGYRSYFISCTTASAKDLCKSKLFEVAVRSRQLGGDLARAALVCLTDDSTLVALQRDIDDLWGASNTTKVFGLSDVRAWSDCSGSPNRHSLKTWLES